jgi:hypothetical protein
LWPQFLWSRFRGFFFCDFHGGQNICQYDVSRTRGLYVYPCSSRIAFQLSGFCPPFSQTLFMQFHCPLAPKIIP